MFNKRPPIRFYLNVTSDLIRGQNFLGLEQISFTDSQYFANHLSKKYECVEMKTTKLRRIFSHWNYINVPVEDAI